MPPDLIPVDHDPFNELPMSLEPVEHDPFGTAPQGNVAGSLAGVVGGLGQRAADWYQRQPSWSDRMAAAQAGTDPTRLSGGIDPTAQLDALGGLVGSTTPKAGIKAYHGSPHDFEAFDSSKIGTGEGAQAYGHGLYFAGNEATAKSYRDALAPSLGKLPDDVISLPPEMRQAVQTHAATDADAMTAAKRAQYMSAPLRTYNQSDVADMVQRVRDAKSGKMYEVNINADPEHFLDWDKPLNEQHPKVQEAFKPYAEEAAYQMGKDNPAALTPAEAIPVLGNRRAGTWSAESRQAGAANLTQELHQAGIPGIKYLDQGSRPPRQIDLDKARSLLAGAEMNGDPAWIAKQRANVAALEEKMKAPQTHNYVVFNDRLIDIARKYGIAGLIAGGVHHFSTTPVDHDPYAQ